MNISKPLDKYTILELRAAYVTLAWIHRLNQNHARSINLDCNTKGSIKMQIKAFFLLTDVRVTQSTLSLLFALQQHASVYL